MMRAFAKVGLGVVIRVEDYPTFGIKKSVLDLKIKEQLREQISPQKVIFKDLKLHGLGNEWVGMR